MHKVGTTSPRHSDLLGKESMQTYLPSAHCCSARSILSLFVTINIHLTMNMRLLRTIVVDSVTRLCDFWKFFVTYFLRKVTRMYFCFWAILKNNSLQVKTDVASFWATFGNFCQTFILTSGYTGCGTIGRAIASDTREPGFESSLQPFL